MIIVIVIIVIINFVSDGLLFFSSEVLSKCP